MYPNSANMAAKNYMTWQLTRGYGYPTVTSDLPIVINRFLTAYVASSLGNFHFGRASFWLKDIRKLDDLFKWTPSDLPENDRIRLAREGLELAKAIRGTLLDSSFVSSASEYLF
jgi:hypothetical protein